MMRVLLIGTLYGEPQARTGQSGKPYTTGKLRADAGDGETTFASWIAFGDAAELLATCNDGASVAISGRLTVKAFEGKRGWQAGIDVAVDQAATLKSKPKRRKPEQHDGGDWLPAGADELAGQA